LLLDRAINDPHEDVRCAAMQALADASADPQVRALLLDRAANDLSRGVRQAVWAILMRERLRADSSPTADTAGDFQLRWDRQSSVRIFSCMAEFAPNRLPAVIESQGHF